VNLVGFIIRIRKKLWLASELQKVRGLDAGQTEAYALDKLTHQPNSSENQDDVEGFLEY
jgi:hypothetical protein